MCKRFSVSDFRREMRYGKWAWPGGYPRYFIMSDGDTLSFEAAKANIKQIVQAISNHDGSGWRIVAVDINWEDPQLFCCDSGERIESAYAEDEAETRAALDAAADDEAEMMGDN